MLRELDLKKKQSDSDFIKSLPSQPGKEFEIKKRLERLRGDSRNNNNNNNNNNNKNNLGGNSFGGGNNNNLFGPRGNPLSLPSIEDFLDGGPRLPPPPPPPPPPSISRNLFNSTNAAVVPPPLTDDFNVLINRAPPSIWSKGIGNGLFGSQAAVSGPRKEKKKTKTQQDVDDFLYELPDRKMPDLELGDGLLNSLGTTAQNLFDTDAPPSKKEEED